MTAKYSIKEIQTTTIGYGINGTGRRNKVNLWIVIDAATGEQKICPPQSRERAQFLADHNNALCERGL